MIANTLRSLKLLSLIILIASCGRSGDSITVSSTNFGDEVALQQNLVFTFTDHVVDEELVGVWTDQELISFSPPVAGRFRYTTTRELIFSPVTGFVPGTDYTATLSDAIVSGAPSGKPLGRERVITFNTPRLRAERLDLFWTETVAGSGRPLLRATLVFNYEVDPVELSGRLAVNLDGTPVSFSMLSNQVDRVVSLSIDGIDPKASAGKAISASVALGMPCVGCTSPTVEEIRVGAAISDIDKLDILAAESRFDGNQAMIQVRTNQRISGTDVRSFLKIDPTVPVTTEVSSDGFTIKGPFRSGSTYELTISNQLRGIHGGRLSSEFKTYVAFGEMEPTVRFTAAKGFYLSNRGSKTVGIEIINVPTVRARIYKIYENNLLNYVGSNRYSNWYSSSNSTGTDFGSFDYSYYNLETVGDLLIDRTIETKDLTEREGVHLLTLDLKDDARHKGVYLVNVSSTDNQWIGAWRMVSYSDLGLIVKATPDEVLVYANAIMDTEPLSGVEVTLISTNNQVMKSGTTDKNGVVRISNLLKDAPGFRLGMVSARTETDFNIILMSDTRVETSRFDVGGQFSNEAGYLAYLYPERDIYRPGETIHLNSIIRDQAWNNPGKMPVILQVRLPNGREHSSYQATLSDQGSAAFNVPLDGSSVTGTYMAELYSSNRVLLASKPISVEEFLPDRIKVGLDTDAERYSIGQGVIATVTATNLFGPPAAYRNFELTLNLQRVPFVSSQYPDVNFSMKVKDGIVLLSDYRQGKTDGAGKASETFTISNAYNDMGLLRGTLFSTVFDESGRPVNQIKNVTIETQQTFFGIRNLDFYADLSRPVKLGFIALNREGAITPGATAKIQVVRHEWQNVIQRRYDDRYRYVSEKKEVIVTDRTVELSNGTYAMDFLPQQSGEYEVRIMRPGAQNWVSSTFYAYGFGYTRGSSFQVDTDGQIIIESDKAVYKPGETARILFKTPFSGRLLVTIERNRVIETHTLQTDNRAAMLDLKVRDDHVPNVYITATLIKPLSDSSVPLTTAHGFQSITVERPNSRIPITIQAPETSRSNRTQDIVVKAAANTSVEMTIAVVDEGILQLKNFVTPDPHAFFYAKRALEVNSFDVYPYLFPELLRRSSTGGDGYDMAMRVNPMSARRARLVSFWSGVVKSNSRGEATYSIKIPPYSGSLRVMAVAWNGSSFGSTSHNIRVADPIVISSALPRFLSPDDELDMSVILTNTTSGNSKANTAISVSGPVTVSGSSTKSADIGPNGETVVPFSLKVSRNIGEARIAISVSSNGETFVDTVYVPVRAAGGLQVFADQGKLSSGKTSLKEESGLMQGTTSGKLVLSRSPLVEFTKSLSDLLAYPYGCTEQIISSAFPQLYYEEFSAMFEQPGSRRPSDPTWNIQEAIRKVETLQLYSGALSYWPGGNYESWWATVYGAHFLQEAKKAGYEVNANVLQRMYWYIESKNRERTTIRYYYTDDNGLLEEKTIAPKEVAYGLYVLAMAGQPDLPGMNFYKDNLSMLAIDSRYLLAAAFMQTGDQQSYARIIPERFANERSIAVTGGSFHSFIRDQGIVLNTLMESDPSNPQVNPLARQLSEQLSSSQYLSTQEMAFALLGLGKLLRAETGNTATATVTQGGNTLGKFDGKNLALNYSPEKGPLSVDVAGSGNVYYFKQSRGLSLSNKVEERDQVLRVRRTFLSRTGQPLSSTTFKQNDLVVVRITVSTMDGSTIENVAISDMLPAGFEIENPRIGDVPELQWVTNAAIPDHIDIRDDRINLFATANGTEKYFYYLVRAVSKGRFHQGPVSADAMYNGAYHSYHGSGVIVVGN
jgi:alpha-2-macroglobulin